MAAARGRKQRPPAVTATVVARVSPENHAKAHRAAEVLGISVAAYVDKLLGREQVDQDGCPTWWAGPEPETQGVLPLQSAS